MMAARRRKTNRKPAAERLCDRACEPAAKRGRMMLQRSNFLLFVIVISLVLASSAVNAETDKSLLARERNFSRYFDYPCGKFGIPKALAMAIARQESGMHPYVLNLAGKDVYPDSREKALKIAERAERRGISFDVGIMQINSYWIRKYRIPLPLLLQPRSNIYMGCWILKQEINRYGLNWQAVGRYHSPTAWRAADYARRVRSHLLNILPARKN
jgi:soluble lytic murein transglycosylase-like protein